MPVSAWVVMLLSIAALWGTAGWAMLRSLRLEDRKLKLLDAYGETDSYPPRALGELSEWIRAHPHDAYAEEARQRYNECVDALKRNEQSFYDWDRREIDALERL